MVAVETKSDKLCRVERNVISQRREKRHTLARCIGLKLKSKVVVEKAHRSA